ncbi:MAG: Clp protease N-terminal domain-containing protein [Acidimicrobiales bacterium]|jgi:ATP-dependent Clp protease ATP-binding subunit ClpA
MPQEPSLDEVQVAAGKVAADYGHGYLRCHHFLLALVNQEGTLASRALIRAGVTQEALETQIAATSPSDFWGKAKEWDGHKGIEGGADIARAVALAQGIAVGMGVSEPKATHLLLAFLWDPSPEPRAFVFRFVCRVPLLGSHGPKLPVGRP